MDVSKSIDIAKIYIPNRRLSNFLFTQNSTKKPNTHRLTKMPSFTRGQQYLLYRSRMTAVSTKICIIFFKNQIEKIMLKNKSEVLANYHKSSLVLKSIIQFPRKKANKTCKSVFVSKIICYLVTLEHTTFAQVISGSQNSSS